MKVVKRRQQILEAVQNGLTDLSDICARFGVSEATARRDLHVLQEEGQLLRTYGGAVAQPIWHEPEESLESRQSHDHAAKAEIARHAVSLVAEGDTIFIDAGTTTQFFARELTQYKKLHVFTNNLLVVQTLASRDMQLSMLGGDMRAGSMGFFGPLAQLCLERQTFDKVFTSADGVDAGLGLCEGSTEQAWFKEKVFSRSREIVVLAAAEKLNRRSQMYWTPISRAWTLVTDSGAPAHQLQPFLDQPLVTVVHANSLALERMAA